VVPSKHDPAKAFVTITGFHRDDFRPLIYRTDDYGATWQSIASNLTEASANVLVEDAENPSLLFLGTDHGLFVTVDGGGRWVPFQSNMPIVPVRDIVIHPRENDLVVGTHGRGAFVTDITPLQQLGAEVLAQDYHLFTPEPKGRRVESGWGNFPLFGWRHVVTANEPNGTLIDIYQRGNASAPIRLSIQDAEGNEVWSRDEPGAPGLHRIVFPLQGRRGQSVDPGEYTVTMEAGGMTQTRTFVVKPPVVLPRR
jgi:hypothetical protein